MDKAVSKICSLLSAVMVIGVLLVGVVMIGPRLTGNDIFAVMSGSMEPYYHVGSVVIVDKHVDAGDIEVGDPITFYKGDQEIATHRVVEIDYEGQTFITKGDANESADMAPVPFESLIGRAGISIPFLGYIPLYMRTPKGMFAIGAYVIVFLLFQIIPELVKPEKSGKEEKQRDEKGKENV